MALQVPVPLPAATERVVHDVIGCAIEVHRRLGPGLLEGVYADALAIELEHRRLRYQRDCEVAVEYRGRRLRPHRVDLIVERQVLLELKAVDRLVPVFEAQLIACLRTTGLRVGLLLNFNAPFMKEGIRRLAI